jgi:hypothetical protein
MSYGFGYLQESSGSDSTGGKTVAERSDNQSGDPEKQTDDDDHFRRYDEARLNRMDGLWTVRQEFHS